MFTRFFVYLNYVLYTMFGVAVLVKGHVEDRFPQYCYLGYYLAVKSHMRPFVFSRVLAMAETI